MRFRSVRIKSPATLKLLFRDIAKPAFPARPKTCSVSVARHEISVDFPASMSLKGLRATLCVQTSAQPSEKGRHIANATLFNMS
ncbi:hypothetical protein DSM25558_2368 [Agrobacterium sp. DSM 25558]|nr:hypothetical protein DSM25558_2368 [Agrobacterium sp. DSM 25558]